MGGGIPIKKEKKKEKKGFLRAHGVCLVHMGGGENARERGVRGGGGLTWGGATFLNPSDV